jgi:iron complex transport system substrate-binding protein
VRIVSLLPSATEIVYLLGLEDHLVGVTHECDWPPAARQIAVVSHSTLPPTAEPAEIDRLVSESISGGEPVYRLDDELIRELRPDMVLTQDLCAVCAVPSGHVQAALDVIGCPAQVISLDPSSLAEVLDNLGEVGRATGTAERAEEVASALSARLDQVRQLTASAERRRVFALEWGDPPFNGGHWVPEMIEAAGGEAVLGAPNSPSVRVSWQQIQDSQPDVVVFMPCGYDLDEAAAEGEKLKNRPELASADQFLSVYADAYYSRPGPRLVDGVEALAAALHPDLVTPSRPDVIRRLR